MPTPFYRRKATAGAPSWLGAIAPPGSKSRARTRWFPRNLGDLADSVDVSGTGARLPNPGSRALRSASRERITSARRYR